ncbi:MAG: T9SS type A sorting domain-containing protein [Bacteroidia bacterium]
MNIILKYFYLSLCILFYSISIGQVRQQLPLPSVALNFADSVGINNLNTISSDTINIQALQAAADSISSLTGDSSYLGKGISVDIDVKQMANHQSNNSGVLYRLKIALPGATFIQFHFDQFYLPSGSILYFYNPEMTLFYGGYSEQNNRSTNKLATALFNCDTIIIEYYEPYNNTNEDSPLNSSGILHINKVIAGFRTLQSQYGTAADCDIDIACPLGNNWQTQASSLAIVLLFNDDIDLLATGSGNLINNTSDNVYPYFLTANHLLSVSDPGFWYFMFHFDDPQCNKGTPPTTFSISGAGTLENGSWDNSSDFALLKLSETPPNSYNVCYAGWDNVESDVNTNDEVIGISHPQGDASKIVDGSIGTNTIGSIIVGTNTVIPVSSDFWNVVFSKNDGFIEEGSSGSMLFDYNSGNCIGTASVEPLNVQGQPVNSCTNPPSDGNQAWYGKFSQAWTDGNFAGILDPTNTGYTSIGAYCTPNGSNPPDPEPCPTVGSGFSINGQESGLVNVCQGAPLNTSCIEIGSNLTQNGWQGLFNVYTVSDNYEVIFQQEDADLNIIGSPFVYQYNIQWSNVPANYGPADIPNTDIYYLASLAGLSLQPGNYYRITISAQYFTSLGSQYYYRHFYIMPTNGILQNADLTQNYSVENNVVLLNDYMHYWDVSTVTASSSVSISSIDGPTTIVKGASFKAYISPNLCLTPTERPKRIIVGNINLPNDFYQSNWNKITPAIQQMTEATLNVLPNPSNGNFIAKFNQNINFKMVTISDMLGRTIYENNNASGNEISINLASVSSGVYLLKAIDLNGKQYSKKLEIQ